MPTRKLTLPSEPPAIAPGQAVQFIKRQMERLSEIEKLAYNDPKNESWESTTRDVLDKAFGRPNGQSHQKTDEVIYASGGPLRIGMSPHELQRNHATRCRTRMALLEAYIEQLSDGISPRPLAVPNYGYHPAIAEVSFALLSGGHYKQAALEAYIRVIRAVKERSGLPLDGDPLMNQAFGCDGGRVPPVKFNSLSTESERDEQRGIMYLFKGVVGLRNAKAHSNTLFDDPSRAHEYLALASLLLRLLEISIV